MDKIGTEEKIGDFARKKRHKLFERLSIFTTLMGLFHFSQDLISGAKEATMFDALITIVLFSCYLLHRRGYRNTARIIGLSFLNFCFVIYACLVPAEVGIYLFYFPLMGISMAIFDPAERVMRIFFVLLSGTLLISLFVSDFNLFGSYEIVATNVHTFYIINLISSAFILVMSIRIILKLNEESERRLHLLAEEIRVKNINLEKTNTELDRFFYSTSHDLRSPLLSIKGLVNIAKNDTSDGKMHRYLDMMTDRVEKLDLFIKDIIDYSRNTRTEVVQEDVNIIQLMEDVKENFQFLEGAEKIQFQNEIKVDKAFTDKTRLTVILNNLISNAIKYHNYDHINQWVKVSTHNGDSALNIVVSDNGPGISIDRQTKIFDMFYRGTERSKGSGLGLYIVKETIEKMKGSIRVESVEGEGTSFIVRLPVSSNNIA